MALISTGTDLQTFCTNLNGGASIDTTLLNVLVNTAQAILEEERPWMVLRKTNTSLTATTSGTWQTVISLATITDFSRFYGEWGIRLFDGNDRIEYYRQVPWDRRLEYKDTSNTFCYDENSGNVYLNGTVPFSGTLYINYVSTSTAIDVESASAVWTLFPTRFLPLVAFYAIGIFKGGIDYDSINRQMLPTNQATMMALKSAMEKWDDSRQLSVIENNDPTALYEEPRNGAINRYD